MHGGANMKKLFLLILSLLLVCSMVSCIQNQENESSEPEEPAIEMPTETPEKPVEEPDVVGNIIYSNMTDIKTIMEENDDYIIVDVRTFEEYCEGHIPGAINIPNEDIVDTEPELLANKDQMILIYCRSGNRSKQAAEKLANMGYTNLIEFGGMIDWDGEIVTGEEPYNLLLQLRLPMPDVLTYKIQFPKWPGLGRNH
jgi:rhodanese-related sulfurtransferase